ncbi:hypothetical protein EB155_02285 [archaeon]|nr:hypothetical protein [archaeon]
MPGLIKVDDIQSNTENEKIRLFSGLQDPSGNTILDLVSVGSDNYYHNCYTIYYVADDYK